MNVRRSLQIVGLVVAMIFVTAPIAFTLPQIEEVVSGTINVEYSDANTMTINASADTIINYSSFDVFENESLYVTLPSSNSRILNRVTGSGMSSILGDVNCNGQFVLVNSSGIHVGPNANINAASVILSTRDITDSNFLARKYIFEKLNDITEDTMILNEGNIQISNGGFGVLIAGAVENRGVIRAPAGMIALVGGDAVTLGVSDGGLISVAIDQKTASTIYDISGNSVLDQVKNTGLLEAAGGMIWLKAESITDIFRNAINLEGFILANRLEALDGMVKLVGDGDVVINAEVEATDIVIGDAAETVPSNVAIESGFLKAEDSIEILSNFNIDLAAVVEASSGDIVLFADHDGDGVGEFRQNSSMIEAKGEGSIYIDGSAEMTLGSIKTALGAIKIGTKRAPEAILGTPRFIHAEGDLEITGVDVGESIVTLNTARGDVLRYAATGEVVLEAEAGVIRDVRVLPEAIPAGYLKLVGAEFYLTSSAVTTHLSNNVGNMTVEEAIIVVEENIVKITGLGIGDVTYLTAANITLEAPRGDINTTPGVIIPGSQVKLSANKIGSYDNPVGINADLTYINRIQGDIDVSEMWGLGTTLCIRGPAPSSGNADSWGAITYEKGSNLVLEAERVVLTDPNPSYFYGNITFYNFETTIPDKEIYFEAGKTYTFKNSLNIIGAPDLGAEERYIKLRSQTDGVQWNLDIQTENYILDRVSVKDTYAGKMVIIPIGNDAGNNVNFDIDPLWDGGGLDNNWSTPDNWEGNAVPVSNNLVTFDGTLGGGYNKDCTIDDVGGWNDGDVEIDATYTGTITQVALFFTDDFHQAGGTFVGSSTNTMTVSRDFTLMSGADFTAPAGKTMNVWGNFTINPGAAFTQNSGTMQFRANSNHAIQTNGATFWNVRFNKTGSNMNRVITLVDSFTVANTLTVRNNDNWNYTVQGDGTQTITVLNDVNFPASTGGTQTGSVYFGNSNPALNFTVDLADDFFIRDAEAYMRANLTFSGTKVHTITQQAGYIDKGTWTLNNTSNLARQLTNLTLGGNLDIATRIWETDGYNLTVSGTLTNTATLRIIGSETISITNDTDSGLVEYTGDGSYTGLAAGNSYYDLLFSGEGDFTLTANVDINGDLSFTHTGYDTFRAITIDSTKVDATLTNFPLLFNTTDANFATVANGGHVEDANGYDIIFTDALGVPLDHEMESYDPVTGEVTAWIRVPSVSNTVDTVIRVYYGNSAITTSQENIPGVWDANFGGVWHMDETSGTVFDSTTNANDGTPNLTAPGTQDYAGQIDGGIYMDSDRDDNLIVPNSVSLGQNGFSAITVSLWLWSENDVQDTGVLGTSISPRRGDGDGYSFMIRKGKPGSALNFYLTTTGGDQQDRIRGGYNLVQTWQHIVGTYDGTTMNLYQNGVSIATPETTLSGNVMPNDTDLYMGDISTMNKNLYGTMDEVRISDTARSADWISAEYRNQSSPSTFYALASESSESAYIDMQTYTMNLAGDLNATGQALTGTGTVVFDGAVQQTITPATINFYNMSVTNSSASILISNNPVTVTNDLSIGVGAVLDINGNNITATGATFDNKGTFQLQGGETVTGLTNDTAEGTFRYMGDGDGAIDTFTIRDFGATDYFNLVINDQNATKDIFQTAADINVAGALSVTAGTMDISTGSNTLTAAGALTVDGGTLTATNGNMDANSHVVVSSGTLTAPTTGNSFNVAGNWTRSGGTFTNSNGLVTFDGTAVQSIDSGGTSFYGVTVSNSSANVQLTGNALTATNALSIGTGVVFDLNGIDLTATGAAFDNKGTVQLQGGETVTGLVNDVAEGTFLYVGNGDGSIDTFAIIDFGATDYFNLVIDDPNATKDVFQTGANLDIAGALDITAGTLDISAGADTLTVASDLTIAGGTLLATNGSIDANSSMILSSGTLTAPDVGGFFNVAGNWTRSGGTFTHSSGTVTIDGSGTSTISGSNTFGGFVCTTTPKQINFASGETQTVTGAFTINGTTGAGNTIILRSTNNGTYWNVDPQGTRSLDWVDVKDSKNIHVTVIPVTNATNSGHNYNWDFPPAPYDFTGTVYSDQGTTLIGTGVNIVIAVNGTVNTNVNTDGSSVFSFVGVMVATGDIVMVYINDHGTGVVGNTALMVGDNDVVGMDIYGDTVIGRHENAGQVITNGMFSGARESVVDTDIIFGVTGTELTLDAGKDLLIWQNDTYTPGGNVNCSNLILAAGSTYNAGNSRIKVSGSWQPTGTFNADTSTVELNSTLAQTLNPAGYDFYGLDISNTSASGVQLTGDVVVTNTLQVDAGSVLKGNGRVINTTGATIDNNGTIEFTGEETLTGFANDVDSGEIKFVGNGDGTADNFTLSDFGIEDYYHLRIADNNPIKEIYHTNNGLRVKGNLNVSNGSLNISTNGNTMTVDGTLTVDGGTLEATSGSIVANGDVVVSSGTLTAPDATGSFDVKGNWSHSGGTLNTSGGRVTFSGTTQQDLDAGTASFNALTVSNNSAKVKLINNQLTVTSDLAIGTGGTLELAGMDLVATGATFDNKGTLELQGDEALTGLVNDTAEGTVKFVGTGGGNTLTIADFGTDDYYHLQIADNNPIKDIFKPGAALKVKGTLDLSGGTFDPEAYTVEASSFTQSGGTFNAPSTTFTVNNDFNRTGGTYAHNSGTLTFDATDDGNTITTGGATFNDVTFNATGSYTLSDDMDVDGDLQFNNLSPWANSYLYRKSIIVDSTKVDATLTDYPFLFNVTDADLATLANGGHVENANGYDIVITDAAGTVLDFEIETYDASTGQFVVWARIPSLSSTVDTTLYVYYGNSAISASQENATAVWDANFGGVWHFDETTGTVFDSTGNANNGTPTITSPGTQDSTGKIDGDIYLDINNDDYVIVPNSASLGSGGLPGLTYSMWVYADMDADMEVGGTTIAKDGDGFSLLQRGGSAGTAYEFNLAAGNGQNRLRVGDVVVGSWQYVVATYDGNTMMMYFDGAQDATTFNGLSGNTTPNDTDFNIGRILNENNEYWYGEFDEIRISNVARSAGWISTEYNNQSAPSTFYTASTEQRSAMEFNMGTNALNIAGNFTGATDNIRGTGTVTLDGTSSQTLTSSKVQFYNLIISNTSNGGVLPQDKLTVTNAITVSANSVINLGTQDLNVTGATLSNNGTLKLDGSQTLTGLTMDTDSGLVEYTGDGVYASLAAGNSYNSVRFSGNGSFTLSGNLDINSDISFASPLGYDNSKTITIDYTKVGEQLTDFPMLFATTDVDLRTAANGGQVQDANGYDIIFTDANGVKLDHEVESYDPTTGLLVAWVKVPTLSNTEDTILNINYGSATVSTSQENITGVWGSGYGAVWHMDETADLVYDSTSNNNDGTVFAFFIDEVQRDTAGQIDGADGFTTPSKPGYPGYFLTADSNGSLDMTTGLTVSAWVNADVLGNTRSILAKGNSLAALNYFMAAEGTEMRFGFINGGLQAYTTSGVNLQTGTWYHVAATYNDAANNVRIYVDGVEEVNTPSAVSLVPNDGDFYISADSVPAFGAYGWEGNIDEVRVANTAKTAGWITTEYNNQFAASTFYTVGVAAQPSSSIALGGFSLSVGGDFSGGGGAVTGAGTIVLDGTSAQELTAGPMTFSGLTIANTVAGGVTLNDNITVTGTITIQPNAILDLQTNNLVATGATFVNDGTLKVEGSQTITNLTMDVDSGTVEYTGDGSYTGLAAGNNYYNLTFTGGGTYTLTGDLDVNNNLTFPGDDWYDATWAYRERVTVLETQVDEDVTNFPIYLDLSLLGAEFFNKVQADGADVVVTSFDGTTVLKREVVAIDKNAKTGILWFEAASLSSTANSNFYVYAGKASASSANDPDTWSSNYLGVWHLQDDFADSTSANHDLTNSSTTDAAGMIGDGQYFTAGATLEDADAGGYINGLDAFTVSMWVKADSIGTDNGLMITKDPDGKDGWMTIRYDSAFGDDTNLIRGGLQLFGWTDINLMKYESAPDVQTTSWQHVALTWQSDGEMALYLDGTPDTSSYSAPARNSTIAEATTLIFGKGAQDIAAGEGWSGLIDEVSIANTARSAGWISTEYNNQSSPGTFFSTGSNQVYAIVIDQGTYNLTLGGSLDNTDDVASIIGNGTFIFDDNTRISYVFGNNRFFNLMSTTAGKQIVFKNGKLQTVEGMLTFTGAPGQEIQLSSTTAGQWKIDAQGGSNVSFVNVQDSTNINATDITATSSIDSGDNPGWTITP